MLELRFVAESDEPELHTAVAHYQMIWREFGATIVTAAKKITGLEFPMSSIKATVHNGHSKSHPLTLQATTNRQRSRGDLVHELMHILLVDNNIHSDVIADDGNHGERVHKLLDLILYDVYVEVYGHTFARDQVALEKSQNSDYKEAWEWTLNMTPAERKSKFQQIVATKTP
jgi:hypothetical protein